MGNEVINKTYVGDCAQTFCSKVMASFNSPPYVRMLNGTTPAHCTCMMSMSALYYCILQDEGSACTLVSIVHYSVCLNVS